MAIQLPDPGTGVPADKTGDSPWLAMKKVRENFSNTAHAASYLVGTEDNQIPLAQNTFAAAFNRVTDYYSAVSFNCNDLPRGKRALVIRGAINLPNMVTDDWVISSKGNYVSGNTDQIQIATGYTTTSMAMRIRGSSGWRSWVGFYTTGNVTKDANGFLKGASPVIDMYDNKIDLNNDAEQQGGITFEKLGVGDYLIKGSLGFAQEGWHIETPKDTNGNVLVAVVETQLENNDLSIKTYDYMLNKKGRIVPDTETPLDIPTGRFISLRLHELPKEPPVMPTELQTEV